MENLDWLEYTDESTGIFRCATLDEASIHTCLFIARDASHLPERQWLAELFSRSALDERHRRALLAGHAPGDGIDPGPVVCVCHGIGRNAILHAIKSLGVNNVEDLGQKLKAGTNCGGCVPELRDYLNQHKAAIAGPALVTE